MLYLLAAVLCSVLIGNLLVVFNQKPSNDIRFIFLGNYIVASLFSLLFATQQGINITFFDIWFGILTGFLFLSNFVIYQKNILINGLSLSVGTMRVSVIIPTLVAVVCFADSIGIINAIGIVFILTAFTFMTDAKAMRNLLWMISLLLISGFTETTLKVYNELGSVNQNAFLFIVFCSAGLFTLLWIVYGQRKIQWQSLYRGFALGLPNQLSSLFFLLGLKSIPATIAYPFYASAVVLLSIGCDCLIWKKMFTFNQRIVLGLLIIGVLLINL
jgi:multidrug transporter EmrE-like cation transporter